MKTSARRAFFFISAILLSQTLTITPAGAQPLIAQVIPDSSLGEASSAVSQTGRETTVEGGAMRGSSLFHSFSEFNVGGGQRLEFRPNDNITNIFTRVTGGTASNILGELGVEGSADLFLFNPNGIIFGPNSSVNIKGSFFATTAAEIAFGNDFVWSAQSQNAPPQTLLTVQPSALFFNQANPAGIVSHGALTVGTGERVQLIGGDVEISALADIIDQSQQQGPTTVVAPQGLIEIGGISERGTIALTNGRVQLPEAVARADISIVRANIDVVGKRNGDIYPDGIVPENNGDINIYARDLRLNDSRIVAGFGAEQQAPGNQAGDIVIEADSNVSMNSTEISNSVRAKARGNSGNITMTIGGDLSLRANSLRADENLGENKPPEHSRSTISIIFGADADGTVGNIDVNVGGDAQLQNNSSIESRLVGQTPGPPRKLGSVNVAVAGNLILKESDILNIVRRTGEGDSGNLTIRAALLEMKSCTETSDCERRDELQSLISVDNGGSGNAGTIDIAVDQLTISGPGVSGRSGIVSSKNGETTNVGNAGSISINVVGLMTLSERGKIEAKAVNAIGDAGDIVIRADSLSITEISSISANVVKSDGSPGNIDIDVTGALIVRDSSGINTRVGVGSTVRHQDNREPSGNITINADTIGLSNRGAIQAGTRAHGDAGNIQVTTRELSIVDETKRPLISNSLSPIPNAPSQVNQSSGLFSRSRSGSLGSGGNITVETDTLLLSGNSVINASIGSEENSLDNFVNRSNINAEKFTGGIIKITSDNRIDLQDGGQILTSTTGKNGAGDISIDTEQLVVSGQDPSRFPQVDNTGPAINWITDGGTVPSGIFAQSRGGSSEAGNAGNVRITVEQALVTNGGRISADTFGAGKGGGITMNLAALNLRSGGQIGAASRARNGFISNDPPPSEAISTSETIPSIPLPPFLGGTLTINASDSITISGVGEGRRGEIRSALITRSEENGIAGNLVINETPGGNLTLLIRDKGEINANTVSSTAGNIVLNDLDAVILRNGGRIVAGARDAQDIGNGGNIKISMPDGWIIAVPGEDSDIIANASEGNGGDIDIEALNILGLIERPAIPGNGTNDIDTKSDFGTSGTVTLNNLAIDPVQGLVELPANTVSPSQVAQRCLADSEGLNAFVTTGQGGAPPSPEEVVRNETTGLIDLGRDTTATHFEGLTVTSVSNNSSVEAIAQPPISEAQGWRRDAQGNVILTAQSPESGIVAQAVQSQPCTYQSRT